MAMDDPMESYLQKLVEHTGWKPSELIFGSGHDATIVTTFNPPLIFPSTCHYEMALIRLETYYSFANIDATNNHISITIDGGLTWLDIKLQIGCYEIKAINSELQRIIAEKADIDVVEEKYVKLTANAIALVVLWKSLMKSFR